jgi:hypothetical protein
MVARLVTGFRAVISVPTLLTLLTVAAVFAACHKMPLVAPSGTVITLVSDTNVLPVNGTAQITAVLVEQGVEQNPGTGTGGGGTGGGTGTGTGTTTQPAGAGTTVQNGTLVSFTTTLGTVDPLNARTTNGQATVKLIANGLSGVATITAFSGGAKQTITVNVGAAAAARIVVTASPQSLPAVGGTSTITANVQDQQGNGLLGVPVGFSTTAGSLAATTALTDNTGSASTTLNTTAAATVTASAGGGTGITPGNGTTPGTPAPPSTLSGTVAITVLPNSTVSLTAPSGVVTVSTPTTFTVNVGTTVITLDVLMNFGDGEKFSLGPISAATSVSHLYGSPGSFTASATASFADGTSKTVSSSVVVADYQVSAACGGNVTFGSTSTLTGTVTPAGMSINDFIWDFGDEGTQHGNPTTHTFQSRGTKTVKFTVVPTKGSSKSATCQLEVN